MSTLINTAINNIKFAVDYTLTNDDYTSGYDHIVAEMINYHRDGSNDYSPLINAFNDYDIAFDKENISELWGKFMDDINDPYYCCDDIKVKNLGYSRDTEKGAILQIQIGEIEAQLFDNDESIKNNCFKAGIIDKIERDSDSYISENDPEYAYVNLEGYAVCYCLSNDYLTELASVQANS